MIDDGTLIEYADAFRTYGNRAGRYWFVGLEESGGADAADVARRLERWVEAGRPENATLADVPDAAASAFLDVSRPGGPKAHPSWAAQLRVRLGAEGGPDDADEIRRLQVLEHGTADGESCLAELLPLPSPSTSRWLWSRMSAAPRFASRAACLEHYLEPRLERLDALVREHRPEIVTMFCWSMRETIAPYLDDVEELAGDEPSKPGRAILGTWGDSSVAVTYPPAFPFTAANRFYRTLGARLRARADALAHERSPSRSRAA